MRAVVQRVERASVSVGDEVVGRIGAGLVALIAVEQGDGPAATTAMAGKLCTLRMFSDPEGKMNLSLLDVAGEALLVSNFTVAGQTRRGRRPSFERAMHPDAARTLFDELAGLVRFRAVRVQTGEFGAMMRVEIVNDGPVTLIVETGGK